MPKQTKLSPIWDYYTETDDPKYAQCKICKEKKSLGSNNPRERTLTNIKRHICFGNSQNPGFQHISEKLRKNHSSFEPKIEKKNSKNAKNRGSFLPSSFPH